MNNKEQYIIVAGGGRVGQGLVRKLVESQKDVVLIDIEKDVCEQIYAETGAVCIHGNATDVSILKEAGIEKADILVSLMGQDSDNLACTLIAKSMDVPRTIVRMIDSSYESAYKHAQVDSVIHLTDLVQNNLIMEIEQPKVNRLTTLGGGAAELFKINIPKNAKFDGHNITSVANNENFPEETVIVGIFDKMEEDFMVPKGETILTENSTLFVVSKPSNISKATQLLTQKSEE